MDEYLSARGSGERQAGGPGGAGRAGGAGAAPGDAEVGEYRMRPLETWLSAALVFAVAVVVRWWAASVITFPRPEDTAYYVGVARNLVAGRGLVSDAIWSFGTPPLEFPRPAFEVWLPLPSFLAAGPMALLGTTFAAAQWSSIVVGGIVAVLAWRLAADVAAERSLPAGRARTLGLGMGLSAAVFLPLVLHSVLPDSTMPFAALVLAACLLATRVVRDPRDVPRFDARVIALGLVLGLAGLTRNEAIWLALAWVIVARGAAEAAGAGAPGWRRLIVGAAIPALLVFAPWAIRDWLTFGTPFPGQALTNALSLDGRDIFAWEETPTLSRYLDAGLGTLIGLRIGGFVHNLVNVLLLLGIPISAIGLFALPWTLTGRRFGIALPGLPELPGLPKLRRGPSEPPEARYVIAPPRPIGGPIGGPESPAGPAAPPAGAGVGPEAPEPAAGAGPFTLSGARPADRPPAFMTWPAVRTPASTAQAAARPPAFTGRPTRLDPLRPVRERPAAALPMLVWFSILTFTATTLLFPVATTWGTFLHASAAVQVLLLLSALLALDRIVQEVRRRRSWTRPVAWLGPALAIAAGTLFSVVLLTGFGRDGAAAEARLAALPAALAAAGAPLEVGGAPVITDIPIWLAEETGARALALPNEPPASVVDLATHFPGTHLLIVMSDNDGIWPEVTLSTSEGLACFDKLDLGLEGFEAYEIVCPSE